MIGYEQSPRYAELVRRIWGEDAEILPPGLILELDRIEWAIHKRELHWTTGEVSIAASVANNGRVQVLNPAPPAGQPGRIVVVQRVIVNTAGLSNIRLTVDAAAASTPAPCLALDTRLPFNPGPGAPTVSTQSLIANNNAVISGYRIAAFTTLVAGNFTSFELPKPVVLAPGHNFTVFDSTLNEQLFAYIYGYERPAQPEEITP